MIVHFHRAVLVIVFPSLLLFIFALRVILCPLSGVQRRSEMS